MWRDIASAFPGVGLTGPAGETSLAGIERQLGQAVPASLRELLLETDGITDDYGTDVVWSSAKILSENVAFRQNVQFRELYRSFDALMFFGDNGGGDQFAFVRDPVRDGNVFVWDHETDSRTRVSASLEEYLRSALGSDGEDWYRD
ncbi:SMI1/KNR4 family protein [Streptomyces sp. SID5785]|uniref:SMI1/KNR4 family protein n=1 Tax=Streptomyces sp. SID5785 TaxID=2690309 RepID=UPI001361AB66|nr:SMI1/KNR4 family protein [Streptomyces sp. SID5785]MZD08477.1 SMI1/KNR4 family protein [Streptomyces sp. SID5785]